MAVQGKKSNYDTDVFQPLIRHIARNANTTYGKDEKTDIALRVIADHVRAVAFAIADGQLPSNNKAGYVIRRILRRAVRYGFTFLNFVEPHIYTLLDVLAEQFESIFPEIKAQKEFISKVIYEEESAFLRTLEIGLKRFENIKKNLKGKVIPGDVVFELYDTFGFPVDLTALIARENGIEIDEEGFIKAMKVQKTRSKKAAEQESGDWIILKDIEKSEFLGYEQLVAESQIARYREVKTKKSTQYQIVLEKTPFYAESGGQVGDRGYIQSNGDRVYIIDTKKENELTIQITEKLPEELNAVFTCVVNENKRRATENNHSATHLMHAALRKVLGDHVQQRGSLVNEHELRFDFSHYAKMTQEEIDEVERIVNEKIRENVALDEKRGIPIEEAKGMGAMALFGEKYGDTVRVITFDPKYSVELCGGTHVPATGKIGIFKIITESSIAAGVRRIEAFTGFNAEKYIDEKLKLLHSVQESLKYPADVEKAVIQLIEERNVLQKDLEKIKAEKASSLKGELINKVKEVNGVHLIAEKINAPDAMTLKRLSFQLKDQVDDLFLVLAADINGKPLISVMISENLVKDKGLDANVIIKDLAKEIKGGGGGQPFYATAGGKDASGIENVIKKAPSYL
jgi:alanyl-tRNA synthetase